MPGLGRSPGGTHGKPLQYSCLENPYGQRSLVGYSPWGRKELDITEWLSTRSIYMWLDLICPGFVEDFCWFSKSHLIFFILIIHKEGLSFPIYLAVIFGLVIVSANWSEVIDIILNLKHKLSFSFNLCQGDCPAVVDPQDGNRRPTAWEHFNNFYPSSKIWLLLKSSTKLSSSWPMLISEFSNH